MVFIVFCVGTEKIIVERLFGEEKVPSFWCVSADGRLRREAWPCILKIAGTTYININDEMRLCFFFWATGWVAIQELLLCLTRDLQKGFTFDNKRLRPTWHGNTPCDIFLFKNGSFPFVLKRALSLGFLPDTCSPVQSGALEAWGFSLRNFPR